MSRARRLAAHEVAPVLVELTIPSELAAARCAQAVLEELLNTSGYAAHDAFAIKLTFEERLVHAIKHGNLCDPDKRVRIRFVVSADRCDVRVAADDGFDAETRP